MESPIHYLVTDNSLLCCYLTDRWIERFASSAFFGGITVREERPTDLVLKAREEFHTEHGGKTRLSAEISRKLLSLYPELDDTERAAVHQFGIPRFPVTHHPRTCFLGPDLNSPDCRKWLQDVCRYTRPWFFTNLGQILEAWWIEIAGSRVLNCHSAVLPYARGMYALENIAALRDREAFERAAGFTIHYTDATVDTGPVVQAERIADPLRFESLWWFKSHVYVRSYDAYVRAAERILEDAHTKPAGVIPDPALRGRNFKRKDFTLAKRREAEAGYLAMKGQC